MNNVADEILESFPCHFHVEVTRATLVVRNERQIDLGDVQRREIALRFFTGVLEALQGHQVIAQVDTVGLLEFLQYVSDETAVEIFASEEGISSSSQHFDDAAPELQNRDVKCSTAQVVNGNLLLPLFTNPIRESCGGRLVDDSQHFEARDLSGILGGLSLGSR